MSTKDYSIRQENRVADFLVWDTVSASGARDFNKGDIVSEDWLGECKTHETKHNIYFNQDVWKKISKAADACGKKPILIVDNGSQDTDKTWCIFRQVTLPDFENINIEPLRGTYQVNVSFDHDYMIDEYEKDCQYFNFEPVVYKTDIFGENLVICPLKTFSDMISYY